MGEMEEKKPGFFERLHKSKKKQVLFFVVSMVVVLAGYLPCLFLIRTIRTNEILRSERTNEDVKIVTHVDQVSEEGNFIEITGWATRVDSTIVKGHVILQSVNDSEAKVLKTVLEKRSDIGIKMEADWNVGMSGFTAEIKKDKLIENICYEILYAFDYENEDAEDVEQITTKVSTKQYVYNGQLYSFNPEEYVSPDITDEKIQKVLELASVCGFDLDKQIWVYQYQDNLYVIIGNDLYMNFDGNIEVPFHLWTTQNDKLPENRRQNGFDNRDFKFANNEISISSEKYHVAVASIPQEYPITNIRIGIFDSQKNEWLWYGDFFPGID